MKISMQKLPGGVLAPASDIEESRMARFKNGEYYEIEIKQGRNYEYHKKVFSFFNYCYQYWGGEHLETVDQAGQFEVFRKHLTCLAGHYDKFFNVKGEVRVEAKSIDYGSMNQEEFECFFHNLLNAAMKHIFEPDDQEAYNTLLGYL